MAEVGGKAERSLCYSAFEVSWEVRPIDPQKRETWRPPKIIMFDRKYMFKMFKFFAFPVSIVMNVSFFSGGPWQGKGTP